MGAFGIFSSEGWRRSGAYNILLAATCGLVLLVCFCISWAKPQQFPLLLSTTLIHRGRCRDTGKLNIILHLALNIISTGILSSSNFFMQIVTSPSRPEIDEAHTYLRSLDIGLQSLRNLSFLSHFKQCCWVLLLLSTIPIHLLFNSAIFEARVRSGSWNLTIATEEFVHGGRYWLPGASLTPSGASSPAQSVLATNTYWGPIYGVPYGAQGDESMVDGYGIGVNKDDYWNSTGNIRNAVRDISGAASMWDILDAEQCMGEYRADRARTNYKSLVIVVDTGTPEPSGWRRTDVYEFDPATNLSKVWDAKVPPTEINTLWNWALCCETTDTGLYYNTCARLLGMDRVDPLGTEIVAEVKPISFIDDGLNGATASMETAMGYQAKLRALEIRHCLAEPMEGCQVRVYNVLILIVFICAMVKVVTSSILVWRLEHTPLVTPGDAIESFISSPDPITCGVSTLSIRDSQSLEFSPRTHYTELEGNGISFSIQPRRYHGHSRKLRHAASPRIWVQAYYPTSLALLVLAIITGFLVYDLARDPSYGPSESSRTLSIGGLRNPIEALLFANLPQLILSLCYLSINNLYTQLQAEQEWNSYAQSYKPLRVSYPKAGQISTYRLQLPYKYSIPLISTSTLLHWLVSNSLYLLVVDGEPGVKDTLGVMKSIFGVSESAAVALGYSPMAITITCFVGYLFAASPFIFRCRRLKSQMVLGGTNSLVLSAACHVPQPWQSSDQSSLANDSRGQGPDDNKYLKEVSRGKVRWGAMELPPHMADMVTMDTNEPVFHLGFAGEDHHVREPRKGELYV
ncbi:hypothetical protein PG993_004819 [Apiospora rasikravindrae]|uniref:DUF6536 domain-containing protein n=1 Tax=Apiospora rasikravindrae TaxID=990691 RepID=A0ABR1TFU9_9PEZI